MANWGRNRSGVIIHDTNKAPVAEKQTHTQDYMKLEFLIWARETNHPEAWRGFMGALSRLQQKVIFLIFQHGSHPVKQIAKYGFEDERTVSSVLFKLSKLGVVTSQKQGRQSIYSIAEPGLEELIRSGSR